MPLKCQRDGLGRAVYGRSQRGWKMLTTSFVKTLPGNSCVPTVFGTTTLNYSRFLAAAEDLAGPYKFGVYNLLVLPHSFPYGGMVRHSPPVCMHCGFSNRLVRKIPAYHSLLPVSRSLLSIDAFLESHFSTHHGRPILDRRRHPRTHPLLVRKWCYVGSCVDFVIHVT